MLISVFTDSLFAQSNLEVFNSDADEMQYYSDKAKEGDVYGLFQMGNYYLNGNIIIEKDVDNGNQLIGDQKAASYFKRAAILGHADSQLMLSALYSLGRGVPQNSDSTMYWNTLAALQGQNTAQFGLGVYFESGGFTEQDYEKSYYWYNKSAEEGNLRAIKKMTSIYYYNDLDIGVDYIEAAKWATQGAIQGDNFSQRMLGICYFNGQGIEKDLNRAAYWMNKAAKGGDTLAVRLWNDPTYNLESYLED